MRILQRTVLFGLVFVMLLQSAVAKPRLLEASVVQTNGHYELHWQGTEPGTPVDVFVAAQPDSPPKSLHLLLNKDTSGDAVITPAIAGRPYFYIASDHEPGLWVAERVLPLQGGQNFRDLGGYRASDGRHVKWGKLYRSGSMADLTPADYDYLANLRIKVVCDLRTTQERNVAPNKWQEAAHVSYWTRDYELGFGDLRRVFASHDVTQEQVRAAMMDGYRELPFQQKQGYAEMFKRLAAGDVPLAFNCTAGKDRTGVGAALILSALGVPRQTIVEDYLLSNTTFDAARVANSKAGPMTKLPPEISRALLQADPDYIHAAFAAIESKYGSVESYLREELGVTAHDLHAMQRLLLE